MSEPPKPRVVLVPASEPMSPEHDALRRRVYEERAIHMIASQWPMIARDLQTRTALVDSVRMAGVFLGHARPISFDGPKRELHVDFPPDGTYGLKKCQDHIPAIVDAIIGRTYLAVMNLRLTCGETADWPVVDEVDYFAALEAR